MSHENVDGGCYQKRRAERLRQNESRSESKSIIKNDGVRWRDAHREFAVGDVAFIEGNDIDESKTWEEISWDTLKEQMAKWALENRVTESSLVKQDAKRKYIEETALKWDEFYKLNRNKFYKDRNYLSRSFPELLLLLEEGNKTVMEVGAGVGNTIYPLMDMSSNDSNHYYAFDCSARAIELLNARTRPTDTGRLTTFVCDIVSNDIPVHIVANKTIDIATMIFFLSSIDPNLTELIIKRLYAKIKFGGMIFLRDYGIYDLTQMRFIAKGISNVLGQNFYCRSDGTFTHFFELDELERLFNKNGFSTASKRYDIRTLINRKRKIKMYRVWVECKFIKNGLAIRS